MIISSYTNASYTIIFIKLKNHTSYKNSLKFQSAEFKSENFKKTDSSLRIETSLRTREVVRPVKFAPHFTQIDKRFGNNKKFVVDLKHTTLSILL